MTASNRNVVVSVEWGYDLHDCPMAQRTWERILPGQQVTRVEPYWYEGDRFTGIWGFNTNGYGSLVVTYDDGGQGFDGTLDQAFIYVDDEPVEWCDLTAGQGA